MPVSYFCTKPLEHWLTLCFLFNHAIRAKLRRANVHFLSKPVKDGTTGTVIVLTTPDAQRTMLAYQVSSSFADSSSFSELGRYAPIYTLLMLCLLIPPTLFRYLRVTTCVWKLNSSVSGFLWVFCIWTMDIDVHFIKWSFQIYFVMALFVVWIWKQELPWDFKYTSFSQPVFWLSIIHWPII